MYERMYRSQLEKVFDGKNSVRWVRGMKVLFEVMKNDC
jgi:hypothetical protein